MTRKKEFINTQLCYNPEKVLVDLRPKLISVAMTIVPNFSVANDCVQDTIYLICNSKTNICDIENIEAYAVATLKHELMKRLKADDRSIVVYVENVLDYDTSSAADYDREALCSMVVDAIDSLKQPWRDEVRIHILEGETVNAVAKKMGFTRAKVKKDLLKAYKELRTIIKSKIEEL